MKLCSRRTRCISPASAPFSLSSMQIGPLKPAVIAHHPPPPLPFLFLFIHADRCHHGEAYLHCRAQAAGRQQQRRADHRCEVPGRSTAQGSRGPGAVVLLASWDACIDTQVQKVSLNPPPPPPPSNAGLPCYRSFQSVPSVALEVSCVALCVDYVFDTPSAPLPSNPDSSELLLEGSVLMLDCKPGTITVRVVQEPDAVSFL